MKFIEHNSSDNKIIEILSEDIIISSEQDILDLIVNVEYQFESKTIILHRKSINTDFFDLRSGLAGAILQKLVNYQVRLGIIVNFDDIESKNFNDFVFKCNKNKQTVFTTNIPEALELLK